MSDVDPPGDPSGPEDAQAEGTPNRTTRRKIAEAAAAAASVGGAAWLVGRGLGEEAERGEGREPQPTPIPATIRGEMPALDLEEESEGIASLDAVQPDDATDAPTEYQEDALGETPSGFGAEEPIPDLPGEDGPDDVLD